MAKDDGVSSWVNFTHAMGNFHPCKPFLFSGAADALTTDGLWRQLGSKVLRVYALDFLYEVKMLSAEIIARIPLFCITAA